jgi:hypothetical protein
MAAVVLIALVGLEAAWRAWRRLPRSAPAAWIGGLLLLLLLVTIAGGLGLFIGGARPRELLHLVYAVIGLGAVPVAESISAKASPRGQAAATLAGAVVALVVVARLFGTG